MKEIEFVEQFAKKGYTKRAAKIIIEDFTKTIMEILAEGDNVCIRGFGTFEIKDVREHEMLQVQTKERIVIPGYRMPKFSPGAQFKRAVREGLVRE